MENTKLIALLKTFDKKELKEFEKFVSSPYHSQDRDLKPLYNLIKKYYPEFDNPNFTKEKVYLKLYPGKDYDDAKMRKLLSYLYKAGEEFLMQIAIKKNMFSGKLLLLEELKARKMDSSFRSLSDKLDREIKMEDLSLRDYYLNRYQHSRIVGTYYYDNNDFNNSIEYLEKEYDNASGFYFYINQITRNLYDAIRVHINKIEFGLLESFHRNFDEDSFYKSPATQKGVMLPVLPFFYLHKSFADINNTEAYKKAKALVLKNLDIWGQDDRFIALGILLGIISTQASYNLDKKEADKEALEISKLMVRYKSYKASDEKYLSITSFRNIVNIGIEAKEYEWVEEFVKNNINELAPEYRDNMKYYLLAYVEFSRMNYETALSYINRVKYEIFIFKLDAVRLNLIILFNLKHYEAARDFIDTTRKYFSRARDLTEFHRESSVNFIKYFKVILNLVDKPDKVTAEMNYEKLQNEKVISNKNWLMKQIEKLI